MHFVISEDGTKIAYDQAGNGPTLILVGGSFEQRAMDSETSQLAALSTLQQNFTVIHYDRRGRGNSTDTLPYAVEREVEDLDALITATGGAAYISGISSGAILAMEAAINLGSRVRKVAMYEPPFDYAREHTGFILKQFWTQYTKAMSEGRRKEAVGHFLIMLGMPEEHLKSLHQLPMWSMWEEIAPTLGYDASLLGKDGSVPITRAARIAVPTLIINGEASYPTMATVADTLANAIPNAKRQILKDQKHEVKAEVLAPALIEFFNS